MHKLERSQQAPAGLARYKHGQDHWNITTPDETVRAAIWQELDRMQQGRCAYCEADISGPNGRHIEHFRSRDRFPRHTFDWHNLFGSCKHKSTCGKHKDKSGHAPYDPDDLIKPDVDDPDDYLFFTSDGSVSPKPGLNSRQLHKAKETIRVFNLDGPLQQRRMSMISGYLASLEQTIELGLAEPELLDIDHELQTLLASIATLPFATAIRHALTTHAQRAG